MSSNVTIRQAVGLAVGAAASTVGFVPMAQAVDAAAGPNADTAPDTLQEVVVTGSRIRRVDAETASAVFVIDQKDIENSGITTVGDLIQRLPSVSGAATNPNVNNGGGGGESTIELRGLDAKRTLVLVDGRRQGIVGGADATDVNQIPINLIDHVEVLKEGAGATYGSDAIAGVVNFITRKDVDGVEFGADYGKTTHNDGAQHGVNVIFGKQADNFHFEAGGDYFNQQAVYNGSRAYSKYALYLYGGTYGAYKSGSSRTPTGRISIPSTGPLRTLFGCGSVTRDGPLNGMGGPTGGSLSDYRCFNGSFVNGDRFNYQPFNLLTTPIERTQAFTKLSYDINDQVSAYAKFTFNHTHSDAEEAPLPFDSPVDDVVISKNNIYNPFGIDFGGLTTGNEAALWRLTGLSDRRLVFDTDTSVMNTGLTGKIGTSSWDWDLDIGYSKLNYTLQNNGYFLKSAMQNAVGPSFIDPTSGVPTCGTLAAPIANCTPLNIFDIFAPGQQKILNSLAVAVTDLYSYTYKSAALDFNGTVFDLPAGPLKAGVGAEYHGQEGNSQPSGLAISSPPLYLQCLVSNEQCTGPERGHYSSRELYLEVFAPILKDLPGVHALNFDGGVRYSSYSLFGSTTKAEFKVEYRPIKDLLVRGTFAQVFRVPTIFDLYSPPINTSVTFNDPCNGLTTAKLAATPNLAKACQYVVPDSGFAEPNGQITGLNLGNPDLKPESGNVKTVGLVYDPSWLSGLSVDIDYWEYKLGNLITTLDANYSIQQCIATGSPTFCGLVQRLSSGAQQGQVLVFQQPTFNLSSLKTDGVDFGVHYALHNTPLGTFQFSADLTDTMSYLNIPAPGAAPEQISGTYNKQFGNYARYRGLASAAWGLNGFEGLIVARYIHHLLLDGPAASGVTATGAPYPPLYIGSVIYWDASVGYTFPTKTKLLLSMQNAFDKQPPIFYQNNVTNANTDVNTYDTLGRRWLFSVSQKF